MNTSKLLSTRYQKAIKEPIETRLLKPGSNNAKLGFKINAKAWRGKRLFSLTLIERETCNPLCHHWNDCYGNNMPFAHRFDHRFGSLEKGLEAELDTLLYKYPKGIVVRLHVLGDFYSVEYVDFWQEMLVKHPELCLFGYTAWGGTNIGHQIDLMNWRFSDRCVIRFSESKEADSFHSYAAEESFEGDGFWCPEQSGKVKSCADCGLCWMVDKTVIFRSH